MPNPKGEQATRFDFALALGFFSPLALMAILSWSHGLPRQRMAGDMIAPVVMGLLSGLVAVVQMHAPLKPLAGLIIHLRAVPVALAGAILAGAILAVAGWRLAWWLPSRPAGRSGASAWGPIWRASPRPGSRATRRTT